MLKQRVLAAVVLIAGFVLALFYASHGQWEILTGLGALLATWEWSRIAGFASPFRWLYLVSVGLVLLGISWIGWPQLPHSTILALVAGFWLIVVPLWLLRLWTVRAPGVLALVGYMVILPTWLAMVWLREMGVLLLLLCMGLVWVADVGAYFVGRAFGKHKLAPRISPGKTWEGVLGAVLFGMLYIWGWQLLAPHLLGKLLPLSPLPLFVAAAIFVAVSIVGDLFESHMKRCAGLKDSGNLIPGHGGILDRIDSQTSALPMTLAGLYFLK